MQISLGRVWSRTENGFLGRNSQGMVILHGKQSSADVDRP